MWRREEVTFTLGLSVGVKVMTLGSLGVKARSVWGWVEERVRVGAGELWIPAGCGQGGDRLDLDMFEL